jgi:hypothetical protein
MSNEKVDDYIRGLPVWQAEIVMKLRRIVKDAAPQAAEAFKWSQPVYEVNGPFCYMKAFKKAVNFGFWRGAELEDPKGLLQGTGEKMRHVKLSNMSDIVSETFADYVRQAVELNLSKGDPTKGD